MRLYAWKYIKPQDKNNLFLAQNNSPRGHVCALPFLLKNCSLAPHCSNMQSESSGRDWCVCLCVYTHAGCILSSLFYGKTEIRVPQILPYPQLAEKSRSKRHRGKLYWWCQALELFFPLSFLVIWANRCPSLSKLVQIWSVAYNEKNSDLYNEHGNFPKKSSFTIKFMQLPNIIFILNYYLEEDSLFTVWGKIKLPPPQRRNFCLGTCEIMSFLCTLFLDVIWDVG